MIAWENFFEAAQGYGLYAVTQSSFSEEDLVSDLIGFHRGYNKVHNQPDSLKYFMEKCEVVGYEYYDSSNPKHDMERFVAIQQAIYDEYVVENGAFSNFYQWGVRPPNRWSGSIPTDENNCSDLKCDEQQEHLPSELLRVTPQPPGENWFWVSGVWDLYVLRYTPNPGTPVGGWHFEREIMRFSTSELDQRPLNWAPSGQ
jgi:hypothetical protein